jgi:CRP-like cAMP-binding protein
MTLNALDPSRAAAKLDRLEASGLIYLGRPRTVSVGGVILAQGPGAVSVALITGGLVKVTADGTFLAILGEGDLIGEEIAILASPVDAGSRVTVSTALTRVTARVIAAEDLRLFFGRNPAALRAAAQSVCARMISAEARIAAAAHENADRRLAKFVCELEQYGTPWRSLKLTGTTLPVSLTRDELAAWTGVSCETVARALRDWQKRGFILGTSGTICVLNSRAIAGIAGVTLGRRPPARRDTSRTADRPATISRLRNGTRRQLAV